MQYMELIYNSMNEKITSNDIMNAIETACYNHGLQNGLDDLNECKSGKFGNILNDVGASLFKGCNALYRDFDYTKGYDIDKLYILLEFYIYLCIEYDKYMNLYNFYGLCYINVSGINDSIYLRENLKLFSLDAKKRIDDADNMRMQQRATDSKQALLNITYSNYRHGWGGQIRANEMQTAVKTLSDIRRERVETSANDIQNARFSLETSDNNAQTAIENP